jgi:hypothetical protein
MKIKRLGLVIVGCIICGLFLLWLTSGGCAAGLIGTIMAVSGSSGGSGSKTSVPPPTVPTNLDGSAMSTSTIRIDWNDSEYETGYTVYRKLLTDTEFSQIINLGANSNFYVDGGLDPGTTYVYKVRAFNSSGQAYSNEAQITTTSIYTRKPDAMVKKSTETDSAYITNDIYEDTPISQIKTASVLNNQPITYYLKVQNDGSPDDDSFIVSAPVAPVGWDVKYYDNYYNNITNQITSGGWTSSPITPYAYFIIYIIITPLNRPEGERLSLLITAACYNDSGIKDMVEIITEVQSPPLNRIWGWQNTDYGKGIGLEWNNNIYVCGEVITSVGVGPANKKPVLLKYNIDGGLFYAKMYSYGLKELTPESMAVYNSGANSYIYVCGSIVTATDDTDAFLLKCDANGNVIWAKTWGGTGKDVAYGVAVDSIGNVYVCGLTYSNTTGGDVFFLKYNLGGSLEWQKIWAGYDDVNYGYNSFDAAYAIAVNSANTFIYLCGMTDSFIMGSPNMPNEAFTLQINCSDGSVVSLDVCGDTNQQRANAIAIDNSGNIYVAGETFTKTSTTSTSDVFLLKYDGALNFEWSKSWDYREHDTALGITTDMGPTPNIYICGKSYDATSTTGSLLVLDNDGALIKQRILGGNGSRYGEFKAVAVTPNNVYLAGAAANILVGLDKVNGVIIGVDMPGTPWGGWNGINSLYSNQTLPLTAIDVTPITGTLASDILFLRRSKTE